jgi:hypothetical protein
MALENCGFKLDSTFKRTFYEKFTFLDPEPPKKNCGSVSELRKRLRIQTRPLWVHNTERVIIL